MPETTSNILDLRKKLNTVDDGIEAASVLMASKAVELLSLATKHYSPEDRAMCIRSLGDCLESLDILGSEAVEAIFTTPE